MSSAPAPLPAQQSHGQAKDSFSVALPREIGRGLAEISDQERVTAATATGSRSICTCSKATPYIDTMNVYATSSPEPMLNLRL